MKTTLPLGGLLIAILASVGFAQSIRGDTKTGQNIYEQQCLRCHVAKLDGNGPDSQDLIVRSASPHPPPFE